VLVNTIHSLGHRALARLCAEVGDADGQREHDARAARTERALVEKCWDDERGLFFDLAGADERRLEVSTVSSLLPLALPSLDEEIARRLIAHVEDPEEYGTPYPVPSTAVSEPAFVPGYVEKLVWRGPSWINTNWYVMRGLAAHGREDLAHKLAASSATLVEQSGFREYYDPYTGEGHGAHDFSWSALVVDMLAWSDDAR
jgi:glycogen debranching enzyme